MVLDPGAGDTAEIPTEVEAVGAVLRAECLDGAGGERMHLLHRLEI